MGFSIDPMLFMQGEERSRAVRSLQSYLSRYTGAFFEEFADASLPDRITASDILAVDMLGVTVPANAAIWILKDGAEEIQEHLGAIPPGQTIWDDAVDLGPEGAAAQLWRLIRSHSWPGGVAPSGMGRTKTSKLLAAKRPHLIPIYDQHVANALGTRPEDDWWECWRTALIGPAGEEAREVANSIAADAGAADRLSVLRIFDIVIWMRVHGWDWDQEHLGDFKDLPMPGD